MKIAIIDTGIKKEIGEEYAVKHYMYKDGDFNEIYTEPVDEHGTLCFKEMAGQIADNDTEFIDINVSSDDGTLQVDRMVDAIDLAIAKRVDTINISLGTTTYSKDLYDVCEKALENNIVIFSAGSHSKTISFPADFDNVVAVDVNQNLNEEMKVSKCSTIEIPMKEFIVDEAGQRFDFSSSSMASARVCGWFSDKIAGEFLVDKYKILRDEYGIKMHEGLIPHLKKKEEKQQIVLKENTAVVLYPKGFESLMETETISEKVVAYFDHDKNIFISRKTGKETEEFDEIVVLNTSYIDMSVEVALNEKYKDHNIIYLGNFAGQEGDGIYKKYTDYYANELSILEKPIIAIAGFSTNLNKIDVYNSLLVSFAADGIKMQAVTNNPIGAIQDADVFKFPATVEFPNIVYAINNYMYKKELEDDFDAWLIEIGGAIGQINGLNTFNFGKLADAYFSAGNIDILVLCINPGIDMEYLNLQLSHLYKYGIQKIILVVSNRDFDSATLDCRDGVQTYEIDVQRYKEAIEFFKENSEETTFSLLEATSGDLYEHIISLLS